MFFRIHKFTQNGREYQYLRLVENSRVNGKTRQRIIANFGSIAKLDSNEVKYLISDLSRISSSKFKSLRKNKNGSRTKTNK